MWMVNPKKMCNQHLLGEHVETHMFLGTMRMKKSLDGYVANGLLEYQSLKIRHDALAIEMMRRGMNHTTPLEFDPNGFDYPEYVKSSKVDGEASYISLTERCPKCRAL